MNIVLGLCLILCLLMFVDDRCTEKHQEKMEMLKLKGGDKN